MQREHQKSDLRRAVARKSLLVRLACFVLAYTNVFFVPSLGAMKLCVPACCFALAFIGCDLLSPGVSGASGYKVHYGTSVAVTTVSATGCTTGSITCQVATGVSCNRCNQVGSCNSTACLGNIKAVDNTTCN